MSLSVKIRTWGWNEIFFFVWGFLSWEDSSDGKLHGTGEVEDWE